MRPQPRPLLDTEEVIRAFKEFLDSLGGDIEPTWSGPHIKWQCGTLAATTPEPHIAFDHCYLDDNGIEVDAEYILVRLWQMGLEQGYRMGRNDADLDAYVKEALA